MSTSEMSNPMYILVIVINKQDRKKKFIKMENKVEGERCLFWWCSLLRR